MFGGFRDIYFAGSNFDRVFGKNSEFIIKFRFGFFGGHQGTLVAEVLKGFKNSQAQLFMAGSHLKFQSYFLITKRREF